MNTTFYIGAKFCAAKIVFFFERKTVWLRKNDCEIENSLCKVKNKAFLMSLFPLKGINHLVDVFADIVDDGLH